MEHVFDCWDTDKQFDNDGVSTWEVYVVVYPPYLSILLFDQPDYMAMNKWIFERFSRL